MAYPDGQYRDDKTGQIFVIEGGLFRLKGAPGTPFEGRVYKATPEAAAQKLASGEFKLASPDEVAAWRQQKGQSGPSSTIGAYGKSAAESAITAATAPITLPLQAMQALLGPSPSGGQGFSEIAEQAGGPKVLENLAAVGAAATGGESEVAAHEHLLARQKEEVEHPIASELGHLTGAVEGGFGLGGVRAGITEAVGEGLLSRGVASAVEGGTFGYVAGTEDSYIKNQPLTAEHALASVGVGSLFGVGAEAGLSVAGKLIRRGAGKLPSTISDDAISETAAQELGTPAAPGLANWLKQAADWTAEKMAAPAAGIVGHDPKVVAKFLKSGAAGVEARHAILNAPEIYAEANKALTADLDELFQAADAVTAHVWNQPLKREQVLANIAKSDVDLGATLGAARTHSSELKTELEGLYSEAKLKGVGGEAAIGDLLSFIKEQDAIIQRPKTGVTEAYMALDDMRRKMLTRASSMAQEAWGKGLPALKTEALKEYTPIIRNLYHKTADFLMDEAIWGEQGKAQNVVNNLTREFINSEDAAFDSVARSVGRDNLTNRTRYAADPAKIAGRIKDIGRPSGALRDKLFRDYVTNHRDLLTAIQKHYNLPPAAKEAFKRSMGAVDRIEKRLTNLNDTVAALNQFEQILETERTLGGGFTLTGGLVGGPLGAAIGGAASLLSKPSRLIRSYARLEEMQRRSSLRIDADVGKFFSTWVPSTGKTSKTAGKAAKAALYQFAKQGESIQNAYTRHAEGVLRSLSGGGAPMREEIEKRFGGVEAPKTVGLIAAKATNTAQFLIEKMPAPIRSYGGFGKKTGTTVSDTEAREWAKHYQIALNPYSILDEMSVGTLTDVHLETMEKTAPYLLSEMREKVRQRLAALPEQGGELPFQARLRLDKFLGVDGGAEPLAASSFGMRLDNYAAIVKQNQAAAMSRQKPRPSNSKSMFDMYHTSSEDIQLSAQKARRYGQ